MPYLAHGDLGIWLLSKISNCQFGLNSLALPEEVRVAEMVGSVRIEELESTQVAKSAEDIRSA